MFVEMCDPMKPRVDFSPSIVDRVKKILSWRFCVAYDSSVEEQTSSPTPASVTLGVAARRASFDDVSELPWASSAIDVPRNLRRRHEPIGIQAVLRAGSSWCSSRLHGGAEGVFAWCLGLKQLQSSIVCEMFAMCSLMMQSDGINSVALGPHLDLVGGSFDGL